jgi:hypothetical protein
LLPASPFPTQEPLVIQVFQPVVPGGSFDVGVGPKAFQRRPRRFVQLQQGVQRGLLARIERADKDGFLGWRSARRNKVALVRPISDQGQVIQPAFLGIADDREHIIPFVSSPAEERDEHGVHPGAGDEIHTVKVEKNDFSLRNVAEEFAQAGVVFFPEQAPLQLAPEYFPHRNDHWFPHDPHLDLMRL